MSRKRYLIINADDYGIGPATSQGILELGKQGHISSSVLLVNSPYAKPAIDLWQKQGRPIEIGWHPALTLDKPLLPPDQVSTLVDRQGNFFPLKTFIRRVLCGSIKPSHIRDELSAQYRLCCDLLGKAPPIVNAHHHVAIFPPVGRILREILSRQETPYLRIVREPWPRLITLPGARIKRFILNYFGRRESRRQRNSGFLGNDWLIGVINNSQARSKNLFAHLIQDAPGYVVELTCHPGLRDETLIGRDCASDDGMLERRPMEMAMLADPAFRQAWTHAGFELITPERLGSIYRGQDQSTTQPHVQNDPCVNSLRGNATPPR